MSRKIAAIVPVKLKSRRLPNKNFLTLGKKPLSRHILDQLLTVDIIDEVYCYSSQPQIMPLYSDSIRYLARPKWLDGDDVKANELFRYAVQKLDADIIVLCHATGPFVQKDSIEAGLNAVLSGEFRCAFSVSKHKTYAWFEGSPLNYDPADMAQTQNLSPIYLETSGFYIFHKSDYLQTGTRINGNPFFVELDIRESIDIDEPKDFNLAKALLSFNPHDDSFTRDSFFVSLANTEAPHKNISHVCFDFDGVLIDSIPIMEIAWQEVRNEFGLDVLFHEYAQRIGLPFFEILSQLNIPETLFSDIKKVYDYAALDRVSEVKLFDNVISELQRLKLSGLKISLATSKTRERTDAILLEHFSDFKFDCVTTPESVAHGRGKPSPDQLLRAAIEVGVDPYNSLYVGDMDVDRLAAKRAGFQYVYAKWGYGDLSVNNDIWFRTMSDLVDFLTE